MAKILLDTHAYIWFSEDSPQLSPDARKLIEKEDNDVYLSIVSLWEMAIKINLGKLSMKRPFVAIKQDLIDHDFRLLPLIFSDLTQYLPLELHHRDPFDRMLIAQSLAQNLPLVSKESVFDNYPIVRIW